MTWALLLLLACKSDRQRHQAALVAGPSGDCSGIDDATTQGDCLAWKAKKQAEDHDLAGAYASCEAVLDETWRAECWFMVSDALRAEGETAKTLCAKAGTFEEECRGHAIRRRLMDTLAHEGQELEALEMATTGWLDVYGDPDRALAKAETQLVSGLLKRGKPYSKEAFGEAPDKLIVRTLALHLETRQCSVHGVDRPSLGATLAQAWEAAGCGDYSEMPK